MATTAELLAQLDNLRAIRASGTREVEFKDHRIQYRTDAELAAAIADLEARTAPGVRVHTVLVSTSKGL